MNPRIASFPRKYLVQAPRGWLLKLTRANDARMRAAVAGRRVAVVGNAQSLLATGHGPQIEAHDIVIRLNRGFVLDPAAQGQRCDMLGLTPTLTEAEVLAHFAPQTLLMLPPKMRHYNIWRRDLVAQTLFYPFRHWLSDRNRIGRRPSSGFMLLSWLMRLDAAAEVSVFGFDFGATPTFYNPEGYQTPHDLAAEAAIVRAWAGAGRLRLISPAPAPAAPLSPDRG